VIRWFKKASGEYQTSKHVNGIRVRPLTYTCYRSMKARCLNANHKGYHLYGGRGIGICKEWLNSYSAFAKWAAQSGFREGLYLDRIDNNKGYCPNNCRWVDAMLDVIEAAQQLALLHPGRFGNLSEAIAKLEALK